MRKVMSGNKAIKTLVDLFIRPSRVLQDKEGNYINGYGYTTTMTGLIFFVILFLDKFLATEGLRSNNWRVPQRLQIHDGISENVYEDFYGFIITAGFLPGIFLALGVFFIHKKSLIYLFNLSLYLVTQMLILFSPFIVLNYVFGLDVDVVVFFLLPVFFIYFFIKLHLNHWSIAALKGIMVLIAGFLCLTMIEKPLDNLFTTVMERPHKVYDLTLEDKSIFKNQLKVESGSRAIYEVAKDNELVFYHDADHMVGSFSDKGELLWEKMEASRVTKFLAVSQHQLLCVFLDTLMNEQQ